MSVLLGGEGLWPEKQDEADGVRGAELAEKPELLARLGSKPLPWSRKALSWPGPILAKKEPTPKQPAKMLEVPLWR